MTQSSRQQPQPRRSITAIVGGLLLIMAAGFLFYTTIYQRPAMPEPRADYTYTIKQAVNTSVNYFDSSFFESTNQVSAAYITDLTDTINATFRYDFDASEPADLEYRYDVTASVNALYASVGTDEEETTPTVWNRQFILIEPTTEKVNGTSIALNPSVEVPFQDYREQIEQLNTALSLSLSSEVNVRLTVLVRGEVDGEPFEDRKTASISAPLNQQLFAIEPSLEKESEGSVATSEDTSTIQMYLAEIVTAVILLMGIAMFGYGLRAQIYRTPYQREVDRIYRLHDGIIIRASKPANLAGKNIVSVKSFDDILNIEEELKIPIVAAPNGMESTQFIIVHGDVAYVYTLGRPKIPLGNVEESVDELIQSLEHHQTPKPKPVVTTKPRKIAVHKAPSKHDSE